jgi:hypothetical protein
VRRILVVVVVVVVVVVFAMMIDVGRSPMSQDVVVVVAVDDGPSSSPAVEAHGPRRYIEVVFRGHRSPLRDGRPRRARRRRRRVLRADRDFR